MFEPEVWRMVRTLEREHTDKAALWRTQLAAEHRGGRSWRPFWRARSLRAAGERVPDPRAARPLAADCRQALSGEGG